MDETHIKVKGELKYLYRGMNKADDTVDYLLRAHRAKQQPVNPPKQAMEWSGSRSQVTIDRSGLNIAALASVNVGRKKPILVRQAKYLNNIDEQDHQAIKGRSQPLLGFKDFRCACIPLSGIEVMHMIKIGRLKGRSRQTTPAEQFHALAM